MPPVSAVLGADFPPFSRPRPAAPRQRPGCHVQIPGQARSHPAPGLSSQHRDGFPAAAFHDPRRRAPPAARRSSRLPQPACRNHRQDRPHAGPARQTTRLSARSICAICRISSSTSRKPAPMRRVRRFLAATRRRLSALFSIQTPAARELAGKVCDGMAVRPRNKAISCSRGRFCPDRMQVRSVMRRSDHDP